MRDAPELLFNQLIDVTAVDRPSEPERFTIVYALLSMHHNFRLRVRVATDGAAPMASVTRLFPVADWFEREVWDMFGIPFAGHPDLRRILTDYGFEGHPLRKDFPLTGHVELRYDEARKEVVYAPVHLRQAYRSFDFESPWEEVARLFEGQGGSGAQEGGAQEGAGQEGEGREGQAAGQGGASGQGDASGQASGQGKRDGAGEP